MLSISNTIKAYFYFLEAIYVYIKEKKNKSHDIISNKVEGNVREGEINKDIAKTSKLVYVVSKIKSSKLIQPAAHL